MFEPVIYNYIYRGLQFLQYNLSRILKFDNVFYKLKKIKNKNDTAKEISLMLQNWYRRSF